MAPRLGQLLQRARRSARMSVDDLANCVHSKALANDPTWLVSRDKVRDEILYIEGNGATRFAGAEYRTFWNSVILCLKRPHYDPAAYAELVDFLINQTLQPTGLDPLLSPPD